MPDRPIPHDRKVPDTATSSGPMQYCLFLRECQPVKIDPELNDLLDMRLSWTAKSGADRYTLEVFSDRAMTEPVPGSPFSVSASDNFTNVVLPAAGVYWWRVRVSAPDSGQYSEPTSFDAREDCLYVYFPYDPDHPAARPDDTGRTGNIDSPFQSINRAITDADRYGISTIKVATRGRLNPYDPLSDFAAYTEHFMFLPGIVLKGGYRYLAPEGSAPSMERADGFPDSLEDNPYETRLEGKYDTISIKNIFAPTTIEGFAIRTGKSMALDIQYCGRDLIVRDCILSSSYASEGAAGLYINFSDVQIIHNNISTADSANNSRFTGVEIRQGEPVLINNMIMPGNVSSSSGSPHSYGVMNAGNPILVGNLIIAGNVTGDTSQSFSCGILNDTDSSPILVNNTIIGGDADSDGGMSSSYGMYNNSIPGLVTNNIFLSMDTDSGDTRYGVFGTGLSDDNYYYNCIYVDGVTDYSGITLNSGSVTVDPLLDAEHRPTASSPSAVQTGGIIDPFSKADIPVLDAYLSDILGAARTPAYVENSTDTGWSVGAYEYTE